MFSIRQTRFVWVKESDKQGSETEIPNKETKICTKNPKVQTKERFVMPEERQMKFSEFLDVIEKPELHKGWLRVFLDTETFPEPTFNPHSIPPLHTRVRLDFTFALTKLA